MFFEILFIVGFRYFRKVFLNVEGNGGNFFDMFKELVVWVKIYGVFESYYGGLFCIIRMDLR